MSANPLLSKFKAKRVLVVGDVMLDQYIFSKVERISPEAPVPIAQVEKETHTPGGAANVAKNIAALGGKPILVGVVGEDEAGRQLASDCKSWGIETHFIPSKSYSTIRKLRVIGQNQQLLRLDFEKDGKMDAPLSAALAKMAAPLAASCDILVVSDYAKGAVSPALLESIRKAGQRILIDPKPKNQSLYSGAYLITPNLAEAAAMVGRALEGEKDWEAAGRELASRLGANILLTLGKHGMKLFPKRGPSLLFPARAHEVYDVSGAGDTVVAVLALALAADAPLSEACQMANVAGGIKVGKFGTAAVSVQELEKGLADG